MTQTPRLPESINTSGDAQSLVAWCIHHIGPGYHPDTPAADYVTAVGGTLFQPAESIRIDELHENAFVRGFGEMMYDHGTHLQRAVMGLPSVELVDEGN